MPENQGFNADILPSYSSVTAHTAADNGEPRNPRQQGSDSENKLKSSYYRTKSELQENKYKRSWFPPSSAVPTAHSSASPRSSCSSPRASSRARSRTWAAPSSRC